MKTYTIQAGDSLFLIAKKFYGDGHLYNQLAAYNQLADPNALEVGHVLNIPAQAQLGAAPDALADWHNYGSGSVYWRVTEQGVEIKGKGVQRKTASARQVERIWQSYQGPIQAASDKHHVPVPVIIATIVTESGGNSKAYRYEPAFYKRYLKNKSPWTENPYYDDPKRISASYGLMQIMYTTAYNAGFRGEPEALYDPATAIDVSSAYIASAGQRKQHQWDPPKIACAYNAGSVRPSKKNAWGMYYHPGHLDRWIPAYNSAVEVIGPQNAPPLPAPEPAPAVTPSMPAPAPLPQPLAASPQPSAATVHLIFPKAAADTWSPIVVDLFRHTEDGMEDPVSITITSPDAGTDNAYTYDIPNRVPGVYDLVFADAASGSLLYDIAEYEISAPKVSLDIRRKLRPASAPTGPERVNVVFTFAAVPGQPWRPMIIDVYRHTDSGDIGNPVSYTAKIPSHSPDGGYLYQISQLEPGTYDFVFTDAASSSVIQDIADYIVDDNPERIDLRKTRGLYLPPENLPKPEQATLFTRVWRSLFSMFSGKRA